MNDIRGDLFGRVAIARTGTHVPNPVQLREPFGHSNSVMHRFCRGCGLLGEVGDSIARRLASEAGSPFVDKIPSEIYFETDGCPFCANGMRVDIVIKPLP